MSNQPNDTPSDEYLSSIFNNEHYRHISDLTKKEKEKALPPPPPSPPPHTRPLPKVNKPKRTRSKGNGAPQGNSGNAPRPDTPFITSTVSTADRNFQQNIARVLGPRHVGKYHDCDSLVKKAVEELDTVHGGNDDLERKWTPQEFERAARLTQWGVNAEGLGAIVGFPDTQLTKEERARFIEIMEDEARILEGEN
ncbi:hypothetical protein IL306_014395 [Fusarium sp. DS 682]|nr:hypothetical protein IL306_014395 [Fusarium sp. DS 682]